MYAGPKSNLKFPLDEPILYALIAKIVKVRSQGSRVRQGAGRRVPAADRVASIECARAGRLRVCGCPVSHLPQRGCDSAQADRLSDRRHRHPGERDSPPQRSRFRGARPTHAIGNGTVSNPPTDLVPLILVGHGPGRDAPGEAPPGRGEVTGDEFGVRATRPPHASEKPWLRMNGPKLWRSGTEYWRALSSDQP